MRQYGYGRQSGVQCSPVAVYVGPVGQSAHDKGVGETLGQLLRQRMAEFLSLFRDVARPDHGQDMGGIQIGIAAAVQRDGCIGTLGEAVGISGLAEAQHFDLMAAAKLGLALRTLNPLLASVRQHLEYLTAEVGMGLDERLLIPAEKESGVGLLAQQLQCHALRQLGNARQRHHRQLGRCHLVVLIGALVAHCASDLKYLEKVSISSSSSPSRPLTIHTASTLALTQMRWSGRR